MASLPPDYVLLPFPDFGANNPKMSWRNTVHRRARITDPDFHGGKTEAIQLILGQKEEWVWIEWLGKKARVTSPLVGEWVEFRNFKEANTFVQAMKRLSK